MKGLWRKKKQRPPTMTSIVAIFKMYIFTSFYVGRVLQYNHEAFNDRKISARMLHITGISQIFHRERERERERERTTKCPEFSWLARKNYTRPGSQELCFKALNFQKLG